MPILHKFHNVPPLPLNQYWDPRFQINNAIMDKTPYSPEAIFIGTFNHGFSWNPSDFFYGRGLYMWTIMANFFLHNHNLLMAPRNGNNIPTLPQIFEICEKGRITFADLILGTKQWVTTVEDVAHKTVDVNNGQYLWSGYKDQDLNYMGTPIRGWLDDNTANIIKYIKATPSIKHIYFTFKTGGNWILDLKDIVAEAFPNMGCSIFTPTGMGFGVNLPEPFNTKAFSLAHCWVWNGLPNAVPINRIGYGHLDHNWLIERGVNRNNF